MLHFKRGNNQITSQRFDKTKILGLLEKIKSELDEESEGYLENNMGSNYD